MGPLRGADDDVALRVALALPPARVKPDQPVAVGLQPGRLQQARLLEDRRLVEAAGDREVGVPAHVGRGCATVAGARSTARRRSRRPSSARRGERERERASECADAPQGALPFCVKVSLSVCSVAVQRADHRAADGQRDRQAVVLLAAGASAGRLSDTVSVRCAPAPIVVDRRADRRSSGLWCDVVVAVSSSLNVQLWRGLRRACHRRADRCRAAVLVGADEALGDGAAALRRHAVEAAGRRGAAAVAGDRHLAAEVVGLVGGGDHVGRGGRAGDRRGVAQPLVAASSRTPWSSRRRLQVSVLPTAGVPLIDGLGFSGAGVVKVASAPSEVATRARGGDPEVVGRRGVQAARSGRHGLGAARRARQHRAGHARAVGGRRCRSRSGSRTASRRWG